MKPRGSECQRFTQQCGERETLPGRYFRGREEWRDGERGGERDGERGGEGSCCQVTVSFTGLSGATLGWAGLGCVVIFAAAE